MATSLYPQTSQRGGARVGWIHVSRSTSSFHILSNAGAPTSGTSGTFAGRASPGSLLVDTTNKKLYINTNTLASPTWTVVGSQS